MGRTAEAIGRAKKRRFGDEASATILSTAPRQWLKWYGTARRGSVSMCDQDFATTAPAETNDGMSEQIVTFHAPASLRSEQYRSLRTRLLSANPRHEHRVIAVTSALPGEGKSVTTVNLGFSLAEIPHLRTLLVDGDLRQCKLAHLMNKPHQPGLAELLAGDATYEEILRSTATPNLFFIPAGKTGKRSATELLSLRSANAAFERFAREFHYTLVDTPPATTVADVGIIGQMTSGVLFIVRMNRTPEQMARRSIKHIRNNNIPLIGGIMIGEDDPARGYDRPYSHYTGGKDERR